MAGGVEAGHEHHHIDEKEPVGLDGIASVLSPSSQALRGCVVLLLASGNSSLSFSLHDQEGIGFRET